MHQRVAGGTHPSVIDWRGAAWAGTTFFNVGTATLASKYRGESEKMVRVRQVGATVRVQLPTTLLRPASTTVEDSTPKRA